MGSSCFQQGRSSNPNAGEGQGQVAADCVKATIFVSRSDFDKAQTSPVECGPSRVVDG